MQRCASFMAMRRISWIDRTHPARTPGKADGAKDLDQAAAAIDGGLKFQGSISATRDAGWSGR